MRARKQTRALWRAKDPATECRLHVTSAATSVCLSSSIRARFCHSPDIMLREEALRTVRARRRLSVAGFLRFLPPRAVAEEELIGGVFQAGVPQGELGGDVGLHEDFGGKPGPPVVWALQDLA